MSRGTSLIGILGGMGPMAGVHFQRMLVAHTQARRDQDQLPYLYYNNPKIPSRQATPMSYLPALIESLRFLARAGASSIVMACDSAYVDIQNLRSHVSVPLINLPQIVIRSISQQYEPCRIGLLAAPAVLESKLYTAPLQALGFDVVIPSPKVQVKVEHAIYDPKNGIKACQSSSQPQRLLNVAIKSLERKRVKAIILGCTDIPTVRMYSRVPLVDPAIICARYILHSTKKRFK